MTHIVLSTKYTNNLEVLNQEVSNLHFILIKNQPCVYQIRRHHLQLYYVCILHYNLTKLKV